MEQNKVVFDEHHVIEHLRHYLPSQAALKDFVHHNTLHGFQHLKFHTALWEASNIFGFRTYLSIDEFRAHYRSGRIKPEILDKVISEHFTKTDNTGAEIEAWKYKILNQNFNLELTSRLFQIRKYWKDSYKFNMDKVVHPWLFRLLSSFLDQGISTWKFPKSDLGFIESLKVLEKNSFISIFKSKRIQDIFLNQNLTISNLLQVLIGDEKYFEQYLFDQQFGHPGWSGFVSVLENQPETLLKYKKISLSEVIFLELLLEIDALDHKFGTKWLPLHTNIDKDLIVPLFEKVPNGELNTLLQIWQEAYEWSYFDGVLSGVRQSSPPKNLQSKPIQGLFCIDDREYSFRRHIEKIDASFETFGTPGFFGVEFYFQPENGKFYTKACPAPVTPTTLIRETNRKSNQKSDPHFNQHSHSLIRGGLISSTMGFWSALKLFINLFKPSISPITAHSFSHMDKHSDLQIEYEGVTDEGLSIGFTPVQMAQRVGNVLRSIGLTRDFAFLVYIVGHGGSSVNNPYYAGYDCGACCGRPGAVNARVFAYMANHKEVRKILDEQGIQIPDSTIFIGAMHDTTRDEIEFYDEIHLSPESQQLHENAIEIFNDALVQNAKERSYRFDTLDSNLPLTKIHKEIKKRSVSIFEPRPEWNHTDNALCIVGRKSVYDTLYLDKRPFINSYDYTMDLDGKYLLTILNAAIPVCGGINLEYYFSRVDQQKLGAGTKLPHNIVGLFAVNTGIDGDLRTGLPSQMIEIHDPVRILYIIEHLPDVVLKTIQSNPNIYEWIKNEWVLLSVKNPIDQQVYRFKDEAFLLYEPIYTLQSANSEKDLLTVLRKEEPVLLTFKN